MNFNIETSRRQSLTAEDLAKSIFGSRISGKFDAVFRNASRRGVICFAGLPFTAPMCSHALSCPELLAFIAATDGSVLFTRTDGGYSLFDGCDELLIPNAIAKDLKEIDDRVFNSPGKINEKGELILDLKGCTVGSHYGVNLLLGDRSEYADCLQSTPKSVLDAFGRGSFRGRQEKQVLATRYELSPEVNGETANRQFYITENGKQIFYSLDVAHNVKSAVTTHSRNRTVIRYETECGLEITRTIFILPHEEGMPGAVEAQRVSIKNLRAGKRELRIVFTGMFGITDPGTLSGDIVYANVVVESELYYRGGMPMAMTAHHQPKACNNEKRFAALLYNGEGFDEYCSSLYEFLGSGSYEKPDMVAALSNRHSRRGAAFFAMAKSFTLDTEAVIDEFAGMSENELDVREEFDSHLACLLDKYSDAAALTATLDKICESGESYDGYITLSSGDKLKDAYISGVLPFQVLYQTYVSRSFAWTQKSYRETGFREIQDIFASMYYMHASKQDALVRQLISSWAENVFEFGYAYHNFTSRGKEPGMCSDDALWLMQAVYRYVTLTGDYGFLDAEIKVAGSNNKTRPLAETLKAILIYSGKISVGKHGLPLLDTADWNDCLRLDKDVMHGPEKEKAYRLQLEKGGSFGDALENVQSESVMNACLLKIAADEMNELASACGKDELAALAAEISAATCKSVRENAWKHSFYARCLINDGRAYSYIGSEGDGLSLDPSIDGSFYLNGCSWPMLADIASEDEISSMLDVIDKYLRTPAGFKLVTPVDYDKLGIVTGSSFYFPGDRENGGVFKHAAMMFTVACLKKAKTVKDEALSKRLCESAFFMIDRTLPYKALEDPYVLKGNPRFCTQYNNSETGEGIGPILSGTASWLTLAVYEMLGISYSGGRLSFNPIIDENELSYTLRICGGELAVTLKNVNGNRVGEMTRFILDGAECGCVIDVPAAGEKHSLTIEL